MFADTVRWPLNHSHLRVPARSFRDLPRRVCFLQEAALNTSSVKVNVYCTGTKSIPPLPCPELETSKCKQGWVALCSLLWPAGSARGAPPGAPSSKGSARYHVGPGDPVGQSPFSSNFCKLFCIFSSFIMLAVSSRQRTSTFNCTCDPRPDGAACSV